MGSKKSTGKKAAAGGGGGGLPAGLSSALSTVKMLALWIFVVFVTFKWCLPFLAELTPPGVDVALIRREAEERAARAKDKCASVCGGMTCPEGWTTGRSPEDRCKCICVRKDPVSATAWDKEHNQAQFFKDKVKSSRDGTVEEQKDS